MDTQVTEAETDKNLVDFFQTNCMACAFYLESEPVKEILNKRV